MFFLPVFMMPCVIMLLNEYEWMNEEGCPVVQSQDTHSPQPSCEGIGCVIISCRWVDRWRCGGADVIGCVCETGATSSTTSTGGRWVDRWRCGRADVIACVCVWHSLTPAIMWRHWMCHHVIKRIWINEWRGLSSCAESRHSPQPSGSGPSGSSLAMACVGYSERRATLSMVRFWRICWNCWMLFIISTFGRCHVVVRVLWST